MCHKYTELSLQALVARPLRFCAKSEGSELKSHTWEWLSLTTPVNVSRFSVTRLEKQTNKHTNHEKKGG